MRTFDCATVGAICEAGEVVVLDLQHSGLTALPPSIGQLRKLRHLNLAGNRLVHLPPDIGRLTHLESLFLAGNELRDLPEEIGLLASLRDAALPLDLR